MSNYAYYLSLIDTAQTVILIAGALNVLLILDVILMGVRK